MEKIDYLIIILCISIWVFVYWYTQGLYFETGLIGSDHFFIDWANHDWNLLNGL